MAICVEQRYEKLQRHSGTELWTETGESPTSRQAINVNFREMLRALFVNMIISVKLL